MGKRRIEVEYTRNPTPNRAWDYQAWFYDDPEGLRGEGMTADKAIQNLLTQIEEDEENLFCPKLALAGFLCKVSAQTFPSIVF